MDVPRPPPYVQEIRIKVGTSGGRIADPVAGSRAGAADNRRCSTAPTAAAATAVAAAAAPATTASFAPSPTAPSRMSLPPVPAPDRSENR